MSDLRELGWERYRALAAPAVPEGLSPARVIVQLRGKWVVSNAGGERIAEVSGRFRHLAGSESDYPAAGDWVLLKEAAEWETPVIQQVLPRLTRFSRNAAGRAVAEQVLAANIDTAFLVLPLTLGFNPRRLQRYLSLACDSGANPVVILTKADLCPDVAGALELAQTAAESFPCAAVSNLTGEGMAGLDPFLEPGTTIVLLGPSGAGKSSLLNYLSGDELQVIQEVRAKDEKGRHTTTRRELFQLSSGVLVIDTPGLRELQLWEGEQGIEQAFGDILEMAARCRFSNCGHQTEPGCAVRQALEDSVLAPERLASFQKLQREQAQFEARHAARPRPEAKRHLKSISKQLRAHYKFRGKE